MTPAARLESLLSQDPAALAAWADRAFEEAAGDRPVVLLGAGGLGRRALLAMRAGRTAPVAFADNVRHGTMVDGVPVLPPAEAVARHPDALFVVTIWGAGSPHRQAHSRSQLRTLGATRVISFPPLFWRFRTALPHYLIDRPEHVLGACDDVRAAFALLSDDASRAEFVAQVALRLTGDFDPLVSPVAHPQYLPPDLVRWRAGEAILDGGAFDGDSLRAWLAWRGPDFARWVAVEPDPGNAARFAANLAVIPSSVRDRVALHRCVLDRRAGRARIDAAGTASAARAAAGAAGVEVSACTIDELVGAEPVSFIKLDIEGAELDALAGAAGILGRDRPVLAIAAYHRQDHLWRVPLAIAALRPDDRFVLRPHNEEGWDLVCYAIPRERAA